MADSRKADVILADIYGALAAHEALIGEMWTAILRNEENPLEVARAYERDMLERADAATVSHDIGVPGMQYAMLDRFRHHLETFWAKAAKSIESSSPD